MCRLINVDAAHIDHILAAAVAAALATAGAAVGASAMVAPQSDNERALKKTIDSLRIASDFIIIPPYIIYPPTVSSIYYHLNVNRFVEFFFIFI